MSAVITPTPGRIVWYWPAPNDGIPAVNKQPLAGIVASVHDDRRINLSVIDAYGNHHSRSNVLLLQDGDMPGPGSFAEWMPYQKGQAAKTEQLQAQLPEITPLPVVDPMAMFADTDGTSASETGLANTDAVDGKNDAPVSNITTEAKL